MKINNNFQQEPQVTIIGKNIHTQKVYYQCDWGLNKVNINKTHQANSRDEAINGAALMILQE